MRHHPASPSFIEKLRFNAVYDPVSATLLAIGTAVSAGGTIASGNAARRQGNFINRQMEQAAGQERAAGQRVAIEERRKADLATSRAEAVAAASGAGGKTVTDIIGGIQGQGEYNALSALFSSEERARGMELQGKTAAMQGKQARKASVVAAIGNTLATMGQAGLAQKYGSESPPKTSTYSGSEFQQTGLPWQGKGMLKPSYMNGYA